MEFQELELKYYLSDLARIEQALLRLNAQCIQPRVLEKNLRFDTSDYALTREGKALRLRYDTEARLTYKGPSFSTEGVRLRQEIEFVADNFIAAQAFIMALGYKVVMRYDKYRTTYLHNDVHILLDELPYGNFIEIEGPSPAQIHSINNVLRLDWNKRINDSYTVLFERLRKKMNLPFNDLIFDNFKGIKIAPEQLEVEPADYSDR